MYNYESSEAANTLISFFLMKRTVYWKKNPFKKKAKQQFGKENPT